MEKKTNDNRKKAGKNRISKDLPMPDIALEKLLKDLEIHRIELEQHQNELEKVRLELEQTKDEFAELFDFAPTCCLTLNEDARIVLLNHAGAHLLGASRDKLMKSSFTTLVAPRFKNYFNELLQKTIETSETQSGELLLKTAMGNKIPAAIELLSIEKNHGMNGRIRVLIRDLTVKKEQDQKIESSQAKLRAMLESSAQSVFLLGPGMELLRFNQLASTRIKTLWQKELKEGVSMLNYVSEEDKETFIVNFNNALKGIPTIKEKHITFPGNHPNWNEIRYVPIYNNSEEIIGVAFSVLNLTQRKKAEDELYPAKEHARQLLRLVPNAIFTVDSGLIITSWNKRAEEITGYSSAEVIGKSCHNLNIDTCHDKCALFSNSVVKPFFGKECTITNKRGEKRIIIKNLAIVCDSGGAIIEGIESFEDITDKKQKESAEQSRNQQIIKYQKVLLSLSKKQNRSLEADLKHILSKASAALNTERISYWLFSDDMDQIHCSYFYIRSNGFIRFSSSLTTNQAPSFFKAIRNDHIICSSDVYTDRRTHEIAANYLRPSGITSLIDVPVRIKGQTLGILCCEHSGSIRNWTQEDQEFARSLADLIAIAIVAEKNNQTESKLRKSEELYHKLVSASPDAITLLDAKGKITFASSTTAKMLGYTDRNELSGLCFWDFIHPQERERVGKQKPLTCEILSLPEMQFRFLRKDKTTFFGEINSTLISDIPGKPVSYLTIMRDVSDRKQAEEYLIKSEQELREVNATKDKFFSIIAHDLKSPFNSLIGFSELLYEEYNQFDEQEIKEFINQIYLNATNSLKLLDNLLEWAKSQTGGIVPTPEFINIHDLVLETIALLLAASNNKKVKLRTELPEDCIAIADRYMVLTILRNLMSNAIKFTYPGGEVMISCKRVENRIKISVSDNGTGISQPDQEKLFRVDQKIKHPGTANEQGTGLGLILCKEFVEKNAGEIGLKSKEGEGSEFYFLIPSAPQL